MQVFFIIFVADMKKLTAFFVTLLVLTACSPSPEEQATGLMTQIEKLYEAGQYKAALDSIEMLRMRFPRAVEARKKALVIWNDASLKMAQADIAVTDSALSATEVLMAQETEIFKRNMLGVRRDSLKARYEALCGVVRMIRLRQQ